MSRLPKDDNNEVAQLTSPDQALAVTNDATISSSTEITLNSSTGLIEVNAIGDGVFLRWGTADATSSAFDEYIMANTVRHYFVPQGVTAVNLIDSGNSGQAIVIEH